MPRGHVGDLDRARARGAGSRLRKRPESVAPARSLHDHLLDPVCRLLLAANLRQVVDELPQGLLRHPRQSQQHPPHGPGHRQQVHHDVSDNPEQLSLVRAVARLGEPRETPGKNLPARHLTQRLVPVSRRRRRDDPLEERQRPPRSLAVPPGERRRRRRDAGPRARPGSPVVSGDGGHPLPNVPPAPVRQPRRRRAGR